MPDFFIIIKFQHMDDHFHSSAANSGSAIYGLIIAGVWGYFLFSARQFLQTNSCYAVTDAAGATIALNEAPTDMESSNVGQSMSTWYLWGLIFLSI